MRRIDPSLLRILLAILCLHLFNRYLDGYSIDPDMKRLVLMHFFVSVMGLVAMHYVMARSALRLLADPSPALRQRISWNPLRHLDVPGFLLILLCGVGSARSIEADWRRSSNPRRSILLVHLSGLFFLLAAALLSSICFFLAVQTEMGPFVLTSFHLLTLVLLKLLVFHLLPIPPLAAAWILFSLLPRSLLVRISPWEKYGAWALVLLAVFHLPQPFIHAGTRLLFEHLPPVISLFKGARLEGFL